MAGCGGQDTFEIIDHAYFTQTTAPNCNFVVFFFFEGDGVTAP